MTVAQLIKMLQSIPVEAQNNEILVQTEAKGNGFTAPLTQVYCVQQTQYVSEFGGDIINQESYDMLADEPVNDWYPVRKDYNLMCLANTVFIYSEIVPEEQPEPTKADLVRGSIVEGDIPHLRLERE